MKDFRVASCSIICFLLCGLVCHCESQVVMTRPPEDATVCRGSDVIINCGHNSTDTFDTVWSFNGSQTISVVNNQIRQAINQTLTIFSINYTTTVYCAVNILVSPPIILTSGTATVTVVDIPVVKITTTTAGCDYVSVSWTTTGSSVMCRPVRYNVTLSSSSSSTMDVIVFDSSINTHRFTVLPNNTKFNINVIGINSMGNASKPASASVGMYKPVIKITATGGCGYVNISCTSTNVNDVCGPVQYNVTLFSSSTTINMSVSNTSMDYTFSSLPNNTQFSVIVIGIDMMGTVSEPVSVFVKTSCSDVGSGDSNSDDGSDSDSSSIGAIAGGVIGGVVAVVVIVILITVVCYFVINKRNKDSNDDDTANLKSPTGTGGSHAFTSETNGTNGSTAINIQYDDKVEYAAPARTLTIPHHTSASGQEYAVSTKAATIPHQTSTSGQEYAVSTKATMKTSQAQPPVEQYNNVQATIKDTQGVQYADLQELPTEPTRKDSTSQDPVVTYSQIA